MPEYTLSLLIWILPIVAMAIFFTRRRLLSRPKVQALAITIVVLAAVGFLLDLLFAHAFFTFPDRSMVFGWSLHGIPLEEFVFYITGFWFIVFLYVFCDEWFVLHYNPPDSTYARYRRRLRRLIYIHRRSLITAPLLLTTGIAIKALLNPAGGPLPGYYCFLVIFAYVPTMLFYRVAKPFVNWRAFFVTLTITLLISIIWEVTLALPRGYWGYQHGQMVGVFIPVWSDLPIEAVSVWVFSTQVILVYEWLKITYFTVDPHDKTKLVNR